MKYNIRKLRKDIKETSVGPSATVECSIIAHIRGRLHMKKLHASTLSEIGYTPTGNWAPYKKQEVEWDMEDQYDLIKEYLEDYIVED